VFCKLEKVVEETPDGAGGLDDDDVWGDVEDVSQFYQFTIKSEKLVLTKKLKNNQILTKLFV
jgi:hypothetical protein